MSETKPTETIPKATEAFTERLQKAFDEAITLKLSEMETKFNTMIETKLAALEIEAEQVLRKGLGVEQDPVIHKSDLIAAIRKATVENTEKQKATAASEKASPLGNIELDPIDQAYAKLHMEAKA